MTSDMMRFSIEHATELYIEFDDEGVLHYANESARQELEYVDLLSKVKITDIFPNEIFMRDGKLGMHFQVGEELQFLNAYRENRTCFPMHARVMNFPQEPAHYICVGYNATKDRMLERQLSKANQETESAQKIKTEFVANVTHELRTPVNGIQGNTRALMEQETDPKKKQLLGLIERGCTDMHAIINNVLDFSKLDAGKFELEKREFNFTSMIDYVKANHSHKIIEKGLDFFVTVSPDVPERIIGDELRIVQVLNNLLSNACKFTSVGKITLEVLKTDQTEKRMELFFMVVDTGIGIDKAGQDKLFQSFSQVDASISRKYGGTGLGLNISKQLVELMEGNIQVESEPGKGTMFSFYIWVDIPEGVELHSMDTDFDISRQIYSLADITDDDLTKEFGTEENRKEIERKMSKLILSVEMENWEKAENFAESVKQLTEEAPREVKSATLRLKMAVQKADYDKVVDAYEKLQEQLQTEYGMTDGA